MIFDKTGTLTENDLEVQKHIAAEERSENLILGMSLCHSLTLLASTKKFVGDPLDIKMYEYVNSISKVEKYDLLARFDFESKL